MNEVDCIIVGQGLAGTTLAWTLWPRGLRLMILDRGAAVTSSRVAAGLITPITSQRVNLSWRFAEQWAVATTFYQRVERELEQRFFYPVEMLRLITDEREWQFFRQRLATGELADWLDVPETLVDPTEYYPPRGGFRMPQAARLDVQAYLDASRRWFQIRHLYQQAELHAEDLDLTDSGVRLPRLGLQARRVIFCQGIDALSNPWFPKLRFDAAKGEILTVRIDGLEERRVIHAGVWLAPLGDGLFRVGATYDRDHWDNLPTIAGRGELCDRLRQVVRRPFTVEAHAAAVRPVLQGRHPVCGFHPRFPQLGCFNGLGSKGALQAPWVAEELVWLINGAGTSWMPAELDLQRRVDFS